MYTISPNYQAFNLPAYIFSVFFVLFGWLVVLVGMDGIVTNTVWSLLRLTVDVSRDYIPDSTRSARI